MLHLHNFPLPKDLRTDIGLEKQRCPSPLLTSDIHILANCELSNGC